MLDATRSTLVVAIGNDLLGDDGVGIAAGYALRRRGVPVEICVRSGLALLDVIEGVHRVLLIDSQVTGRSVGTIEEFVLASDVVRSPSPHYLSYGEALAVGAAVGLDLPEAIRVLAIERHPEAEIGTGLSRAMRAALPRVVARAQTILTEWRVGSLCARQGVEWKEKVRS